MITQISDMTEKNSAKYYEAILQVIYMTQQPLYAWFKGSSFVAEYKEKLFIVTASHCIDENNIKDLFFSKMATDRKLYSIPITTQIKSFDTTTTKVDTDLRIFKVDDEIYKHNIIENAQIKTDKELSQEILQTPFIKRLKRLYKNNPTKRLRKLRGSNLYNTLIKRQDKEIDKAIKNANTSLAEIKNLILAPKNFIFTKDKNCIFFGYPLSKNNIECNDDGTFKHGTQYLEGYHGKLTGEYNQSTDTYSLILDTNEDLNGFSGGPVIADGNVIGVLSYIQTTDKKLYFIPVQRIIQSLDYWFTHAD